MLPSAWTLSKTAVLVFSAILSLSNSPAWATSAKTTAESDQLIHIATFDSGFGGYLTAKAIESKSRALSDQYRAQFKIVHFGDTKHLPYGEKTPEQIAHFASAGILTAFKQGAQTVFMACNTASTAFDQIKEILEAKRPGSSHHVVSIISTSVGELKKQIDQRLAHQSEVSIGIFATPGTVRMQAYPLALAQAYEVPFQDGQLESHLQPRWYVKNKNPALTVTYTNKISLPDGKTILVYQMGPANWVELIEHGASPETKKQIVQRDVELFKKRFSPDAPFDVVGEFCTHYPIFDPLIRKYFSQLELGSPKTSYIKQGPLMAQIFDDMMKSKLAGKKRGSPLSSKRAADRPQWRERTGDKGIGESCVSRGSPASRSTRGFHGELTVQMLYPHFTEEMLISKAHCIACSRASGV
jgi:glutamate racemase